MPDPQLPSHFSDAIVATLEPDGLYAWLGEQLKARGLVPDASSLRMLLDVAFYASLLKEEGRPARFSIGVTPPGSVDAHRFSENAETTLTAKTLGKLSAACDWDASVLLTWPGRDGWNVWGIMLADRPLSRGTIIQTGEDHLVITARDAGSLVVRWRDEILFSYAHGEGAVAAATMIRAKDVVAMINEHLPRETAPLRVHHLTAVTRTMRAHGRGGTLLVVPENAPKEMSFSYPVRLPAEDAVRGYSPGTPFANAVYHEERTRLESAGATDDFDTKSLREHLATRAIEDTEAQGTLIGRLTGVDGIVVLNHQLVVLGFGGKMSVPDDFHSRPLIHIRPSAGTRLPRTVKEAFAGMRHISAAAACVGTPNAFAIVQSQDGALSVILNRPDGQLWVVRPLERLGTFGR